jgi:hypothetical protein
MEHSRRKFSFIHILSPCSFHYVSFLEHFFWDVLLYFYLYCNHDVLWLLSRFDQHWLFILLFAANWGVYVENEHRGEY